MPDLSKHILSGQEIYPGPNPGFFTRLPLSSRLIRCDALGHVVPDVVVVVYVIAVVASVRSEEGSRDLGFPFRQWDDFGVCYNNTAGKIQLRVRAQIANVRLAGFFIQQEGAQVCTAFTFLGPSVFQLTITPVSVSPVANFRCGLAARYSLVTE